MGSVITVRDIDPGDKSWLKREAHQRGVSMEEFVRRLIHRNAREGRAPWNAVRGLQAVFWTGARDRLAASRAVWLQAGRVPRREPDVTAPTAWILDTNVVSEMMRASAPALTR